MDADQRKMLDECLEDDNDRLTAWEIEFLENLSANYRGQELSNKQAAVLERINNKVLG